MFLLIHIIQKNKCSLKFSGFLEICDIHVSHNAICYPYKILHNFWFQFLKANLLIPRGIENSASKLLWEK